MAPREPIMHDRSYRPAWRLVVAALALAFQIYPALMGTPRHDPPAPSAAETVPVQTHVGDTCPPVDFCRFTAMEQALPRLPVPPLLLLTLGVILFAVRWQPRQPVARCDWWWPPDRRRALLQVFLI